MIPHSLVIRNRSLPGSLRKGAPLHLAFGESKIPHGEVLGDVGGVAAPRNSEVERLQVLADDDLRGGL